MNATQINVNKSLFADFLYKENEGNFMFKAIRWVNTQDEDETLRKVIAAVAAILLTASIIGLIVVVPGVIEWNRQAKIYTELSEEVQKKTDTAQKVANEQLKPQDGNKDVDPPSSSLSDQITPSIVSQSIVSNEVKLEQILPVDPYPELKQAQVEFLVWFYSEGSELGKGEYAALIEKVNKLSKDLPKKKIILYSDHFRYGFTLYYVEKPGEEKYMPIKPADGTILHWQANNTPNVSWPLKDPQDNSYFIPEITLHEVIGSHSGSETTGSYLNILLNLASNKASSAYRILEGLRGYAEEIQEKLGNSRYKTLREKIPSYPDLPDL